MKDFKNLIELTEYFSDEDVCREHLEKFRWTNGEPVCPFCGSIRVYRFTDGKRFKCAEKQCNKIFTVTVGTMFENTKVPLQKWFAAMYLITSHKKGISSLQLSRDISVTQRTAWFLNHRIREMLKDKSPVTLKNTVEADETYVGGKNKNRHANKKVKDSQGRSTKDKTPVMGLVERNGKVVTFVVKDTEANTIQPLMRKNVQEETTLITDAYRSYSGLGDSYRHVVVKHTEGNYVTVGEHHTNNIEGFWSLLKRGIVGIYHYVSPKHLHRYCDEFAYRYNSRDIDESDRFDNAVGSCEGRLKYKDLIAKSPDELGEMNSTPVSNLS